MFPTLETPRLLLRELGHADADALLSIHGDAETMRWFGADPIATREQALQLVEMFAGWRRQPNPGTRWGLVRKSDRRLIGSAGLFKWNRSWRNAALGYELARDCQGQGLMSEALRAVLGYGFGEMRLHRVQAEIHPDNAASRRLAERLGFRQEGLLRDSGYWGGRYHDLVCYGLLAGEWSPALKDKQ
ncbi:GNAT family N-acetyltransferase [Chitinimonas koreensis]|uniref:GNAT family N-acetyltransferase n=1 Tax=Chitinimonas koreensis TaxID=356302 RepID=UPI000410B9F0|nr:GNAT family protein [Chitinimonas koreensis]QNM98622.1 GNAT family N-acetyltransferase [Chitinimonas koreensis]